MADRVNKSGRKKSIKAPATELLTRHCPHLAFFVPDYYDGVIAALRPRNAKYRRGKNGNDSRRNVPRRRPPWTEQHLRCGICGRQFVFGGHGQTDHLMCDGARQHRCWNGVSADGPLTVQKVLASIRAEIERLDGFDEAFRSLVMEEAQASLTEMVAEISRLDREQGSLVRSIDNYTRAIGELGLSPALLNSLREAETQLADLNFRLQRLKQAQVERIPQLPAADELKALSLEAFQDLETSSPAFARLMRDLIPEIHVYPFRLIDGGLPVLRARLTLNLIGFLPTSSWLPEALSAFQRLMVVDLFDKPQRELIRPAVIAGMQRPRMTYKALAEQLSEHASVAQRAAQIQRLMDSAGVTDPYLPIRSPIEGNAKYSRHRHPRFRFEPLTGYEQPNFPENGSRQ